MKLQNIYSWEITLKDGTVFKQYDETGKEHSWKNIPLKEVSLVSFVPVLPLLPRHDCLIDISAGERFVKRFGKGFIRQTKQGFKMIEYVNCCVTNKYRFWVFHGNGKVLVTRPDFEVRI